jgi:hypothetical protein
MKQQQLNRFISKIPIAPPPTTTTYPVKNKRMYECNTCQTQYYNKERLKEHQLVCYLIHSSKKQQHEDSDKCEDITPPTHELYRMVKLLTEEIISLKSELAKIKKYSPSAAIATAEKEELLRALPELKNTYVEWLNNISINQQQLQSVFDYSLAEGIIDIFASSPEKLPIRVFRNKRKIYVYSQETPNDIPKWAAIMTDADFRKMIDLLCDKFLSEFILWRNRNRSKIEENEDWQEKDVVYSNKIILTSNERVYIRVKKWLIQWCEENTLCNQDEI